MWKVAFVAAVASEQVYAAEHQKVKSPRVKGLEDFAYNLGYNLKNLNMGMMKSMMNNPNDTQNSCYLATEETGNSLVGLFKFTDYLEGGFDVGTFYGKFKIAQFNYIAQTDSCDYNKFLIAGDNFLNKIPMVSAGVANLITQFAVGWKNKDQSMYKSYDLIKAGVDNDRNWEQIGEGVQLFMAQTLKISAGEAEVDATPVYA